MNLIFNIRLRAKVHVSLTQLSSCPLPLSTKRKIKWKKESDKARETYGDVCVTKMFVGRHVGQMFYRGTDFVLDCVIVEETPLHDRHERVLSHLSYLRNKNTSYCTYHVYFVLFVS